MKICNYHGGCTQVVVYSGRGKRSPLCDEHKTVVRRENARERERARRKEKREAKLKVIRETYPQCCVDWIGDNLRRKTCPQHQTWYQIELRVRITRAETDIGEKHSDAAGRNERVLSELIPAGVRVAVNPDDWWNDKELVLKVSVQRHPDDYLKLNQDTEDLLEQSRAAD